MVVTECPAAASCSVCCCYKPAAAALQRPAPATWNKTCTHINIVNNFVYTYFFVNICTRPCYTPGYLGFLVHEWFNTCLQCMPEVLASDPKTSKAMLAIMLLTFWQIIICENASNQKQFHQSRFWCFLPPEDTNHKRFCISLPWKIKSVFAALLPLPASRSLNWDSMLAWRKHWPISCLNLFPSQSW